MAALMSLVPKHLDSATDSQTIVLTGQVAPVGLGLVLLRTVDKNCLKVEEPSMESGADTCSRR